MSPLTLLCVDDDENTLKSLGRLLRDQPYKVLFATSGKQGFSLLKSEPVQVVVSDYRMPGMTGTEFLYQVQQDYPNTFRMILSSFSDGQSIRNAISDGAIDKVLIKPWKSKELITEIHCGFEKVNATNCFTCS